jgi:hypothetical protein
MFAVCNLIKAAMSSRDDGYADEHKYGNRTQEDQDEDYDDYNDGENLEDDDFIDHDGPHEEGLKRTFC